jgi:hypothetical protein
MKRIIAVIAFAALIAAISTVAHARVIGYTEDSENFPNMLKKHETCSQAYDSFLAVARPLNACHHLDEARINLDAQKQIKNDLHTMKNCRECAKVEVQADEAIAAFQEQIKLYSGECPSKKEQRKLVNKLPDSTKEVCGACQNKWPGTLGPSEGTPCR